MLYKCTEWQGASGIWYCEHTDSFPKDVQKWVVPARILGVSVDEFLKLLIEKFKPDQISYRKDGSFVSWGWSKQSEMRKFKNWINAESRRKNYQI